MNAGEPLSLTRAGLFFGLLVRCRLVDRAGHVRWYWLVAITWIPIMVAALVRWIAIGGVDAVVLDPSVHVRLLVGLPLLLLAEHLLEVRCLATTRHLYEEQFAPAERIAPILAAAARMRASPAAEVVLAAVALASGQAALWGFAPPSGWIHAAPVHTSHALETFWYATLGLPLVQFLMLRWLWRWAVWTYVLARLSRIQLVTNALHPDGAAGLEPLSTPVDAFVVFATAVTSVASAAWLAQLHAYDLSLQVFVPKLLGFIMFAVVVSCGPLVLFSPQIYTARRRDIAAYHILARAFVREFRRKWILEREPGDLPKDVLTAPDFSALNDLDGSFEIAARTRAYPFGVRPLVGLVVAALLPMLPLVLSTMPLADIARALARMLHLPEL